MDIEYKTSDSDQELNGILSLQKDNLPENLSSEEMEENGFVTIEHSFELIKKLNNIEPHIIAKENDEVIGYALSMTKDSRMEIPVNIPMFEVFDRAVYKEKIISDYNYIVMGQVCVNKRFRGKGVFDDLYQYYRKQHQDKYDFAITEIARHNQRSLKAHKRVGFEKVLSYTDKSGTTWAVVVWDWK